MNEEICNIGAGLHHIGFIVEDLEKTLEHFKKMYGWQATSVYEFRPMKAESYGKPVDNYCLKIAMIENASGTAVEVIQPISGQGIHEEFLKQGRHGLQHACICVKNYDEWKARLVKEGCTVAFEAETEDEKFGYRRCLYAEDEISGMVVEIKEEPYFRH